MQTTHVGEAPDSGQDGLLEWRYGTAPGNFSDRKPRPETVGDLPRGQHDHHGRNVNHPEPAAMNHHDALRERCPYLWRRRGRLPHSSEVSVHGDRGRRTLSGRWCWRQLRRVARPASGRRLRVSAARATSGLHAVRYEDETSVNGSRRPNQH